MMSLTKKQQDLLDYLNKCKPECPSYDQMMRALGLKSKSGIHRLVKALEERGRIKRISYFARAIEAVPDDDVQAVLIDAVRSYVEAYDNATGTVYLIDQMREALAKATGGV